MKGNHPQLGVCSVTESVILDLANASAFGRPPLKDFGQIEVTDPVWHDFLQVICVMDVCNSTTLQ